MRIFFLGNNRLGWQILQWLRRQSGTTIAGVAVHPESSAKYGREIGEEIREAGTVSVDGSKLRDPKVMDEVRDLHADIAVSVLFGYILQPSFLNLFARGCINLHPALLPYNRGAFPNVWSIVDKSPAGVTLHYMDAGVDTGDVISQKEVEAAATDTGGALYRKLEEAGLTLFQETWPAISAGTCNRVPQGAGGGSSHRVRDVEQIDEIDLRKSYVAEELLNVIRARTFPPHAGAYIRHQGRKIYLRLELVEESELQGE